MRIESLLLAYGLIVGAILISYYNYLRLEKDLILDSFRATIQLIIMGFVLKFILKLERMEALLLILILMCAVAALVSAKIGHKIPGAFLTSFVGIGIGSTITFLVLYGAGIIPPKAQYVIPLGGMIIGNAMKAVTLTLNHLTGELENQRARIETLLALGANARQAVGNPVRQSVRAAMIPTIATLKTVGLVHLPGIMTGYIIAGGSPLEAVKFQLVVVYMIVGATGIACFITTFLAHRRCFNSDLQLLPNFRPSS